MEESDDPVVEELCGLLRLLLHDVDYPDEYTKNKKNRYCLFTAQDFGQKEVFLELLNEIISRELPGLTLVCYEFVLPPEVILYEDEHQIVISQKTYEDYFPEDVYFFNDAIDDEDDDYDYEFDENNEEDVAEAIERIEVMENVLNRTISYLNKNKLTNREREFLDRCVADLDDYYVCGEWRFDLKLDELGKLPDDLKRGVLSQDGIYNALMLYKERFEE